MFCSLELVSLKVQIICGGDGQKINISDWCLELKIKKEKYIFKPCCFPLFRANKPFPFNWLILSLTALLSKIKSKLDNLYQTNTKMLAEPDLIFNNCICNWIWIIFGNHKENFRICSFHSRIFYFFKIPSWTFKIYQKR